MKETDHSQILSYRPYLPLFQWDDGDPSGRTQKYNMVALNVEPDDDDLGVGERVFFPQVCALF